MGISLENVSYVYEQGTAMQTSALQDVSLEIPDNQFIGLIGHTGSGKSTLVQLLNGLLRPTSGRVLYNGKDIHEDGFDKKALRANVGLVFQYPEHQLFEVDVLSDVMYGPRNLGLDEAACKKRAIRALENVGIKEKYFKTSPFDLSGGQKRRAAIAGVLAMNPRILILDEPTAGLDPRGRDEILGLISEMKKKLSMTIILVSHSMDDVARYVERIVVMGHGKKVFDDTPKNVFKHYIELEDLGLSAPQITYIMNTLRDYGLDVKTDALTVEEAAEEILRKVKNKAADTKRQIQRGGGVFNVQRYYFRTILSDRITASQSRPQGQDCGYAGLYYIPLCGGFLLGVYGLRGISHCNDQTLQCTGRLYRARHARDPDTSADHDGIQSLSDAR